MTLWSPARAALGILAITVLAITVLAGPAEAVAPRVDSGTAADTVAYQNRLDSALQKMVDAVVGPGRAVVTTNAELDFDQVETVSTTYSRDPSVGALAERLSQRAYAGGGGSYQSSSTDRTNALNSVRETRRNAPGSVKKLNIAVVVDAAGGNIDLNQLRKLVSAAAGVDLGRGDVVAVAAMPFRTAATVAAAGTEAGVAADRRALWPVAGSGALLLILTAAAWRHRARRSRIGAGQERLLQARAALETQRPIMAETVTVSAASVDSRHAGVARQRAMAELAAGDPDRAAAVLRGWTGPAT
jgi:flagellar M-ring protein FliF